MSFPGYFVHLVDMNSWLNHAQRALVDKNKVRKELWKELTDCIQWNPIDPRKRVDYFRLSQSVFVNIQAFCLVDGRGDTLSSDQILSWCTTLADLRSQVPLARILPSEEKEIELEEPLVHS